MNYLDSIIILLQNILDNIGQGGGTGDITKKEVQELISQAITELRGGADPTITIKKLSDDIYTKIDNLSITYTIEDWNNLTDDKQTVIKQTYDTVYITGDVSDWCEKPVIVTDYPLDNIPVDNIIYDLGVKNELTIASLNEHTYSSITVTAGENGLTLGIGTGIDIIGEVPETIEANTKLFIGIADSKLYVNTINVKE